MKRIIVIDGNSLLFKAYYATAYVGVMMQSSEGVPTNALYSFINMIERLKTENHFDYFIVAFDASKKTFRHDKFTDYKGTRTTTPDELIVQFPLVRDYLNLANIPNYEVDGYEADDIVGTIAKIGHEKKYQVDIISSDKDLLQLVDKNVNVLLAQKGISQMKEITVNNFDEVWDIKPAQVVDLKGLMGDPSDNIPGVKGVGEKTALKLVQEYGTIENMYEHIDDIKGKLQEKLVDGKEQALMSKELATIITDVKLPFKLEDLVIDESKNQDRLKAFYHKYDLKTILNRMQTTKQHDCADFSYEIVTQIDERVYDDEEGLFIDLVSLKENYHKDNLLGINIVSEQGNYFIKTVDAMNDQALLKYLKSAKPKKAYDLKRNILLGYWHGITINKIQEDAMLSSYLLDSGGRMEPNILVDTKYDVVTLPNKDLLKADLEEVIENKMKQSFYLNRLIDDNKLLIEDLDMANLYDVEVKVAHILAEMEKTGILVDEKVIKKLNDQFQAKSDKLEQQIYAYAKEEFNINSTQQLGKVLFENLNLKTIKKTKTGYSTDNKVLSALQNDHPIIKLIMEYRTYKKLLSTYILPMPGYILEDGRIHTIYNQSLTTTGRLSSKDPNLQNIATRSETQRNIKKMFVAKEGYSLLSFDYSQIELRLLASFSNDEVFINAFKKNLDIHKTTAAKVAGIPESKVTAAQRKAAKAINFGIVYGISDFGLSAQLDIPVKEANEFITKYYETYPNIKHYLDHLIEESTKTGYSKTILNRIRYIPELKSNNYNIKESGKRIAMNAPLQGSAADILKLAMIRVDQQLKKTDYDIKMLLQVHDELIFEVKNKDMKKVIPIIEEAMDNAYKLEVKLASNHSSGKSWYDL